MTVRQRLHVQYVQAQAAADRDEDDLRLAREAERAWDAYADECARLEQCTFPGCFTPSPHRAYCPAHDDNPPDCGD